MKWIIGANPDLRYFSLASAYDMPAYWWDGRVSGRFSIREMVKFADPATSYEDLETLVADAEGLARAAVEGRLDARADASRHQGDFRKIVQGVNQTLDAVIGKLRKRGIQVVLSDANPRVLGKLRRAGVTGKVGTPDYAEQFIDAVSLLNTETAAPLA
jgi:hypothetical protein